MPTDRYDTARSYEWNYDHPPEVRSVEEPPVAGDWTFCGMPVGSPLGVAAGPLLNGAWCRYYAALGFDVVTYKTVRSCERACYPPPNLLPVETPFLHGGETNLAPAVGGSPSWAISFGMPSRAPAVWAADVAETRRLLPAAKRLSVSVVGTQQEGWSLEELADDYAECARLAAESGSDAVEFNLSCPNVTTCDGQLYQNPSQARVVAERVRAAVGGLPLIAKIGHDPSPALLDLVDELAASVDALATTNCVAATIRGAFDGAPRGIGGAAILDASVRQAGRIAEHAATRSYDLRVVGVGGAADAAGVRRYLDVGAECVHLATAVMLDPSVGLKIRAAW